MNKKILVTGATGFVGSYLTRHLVKQGASVRALKRKDSAMTLVDDVKDKIEWVESDILDVIGLEDAMVGIHQVYHCAAMVSFNPKDINRMMKVNGEGTANVVNAALNEGVDKMLHISSIAAIGRTKNQKVIDEKTKWERSKYNSHYANSKHSAEQEVWRGIAEGLTAVIINPSVILGAGFWNQGTCRLFKNVWDGLRFYPTGATGFVDVRDVARMSIQLMESDIESQRFIANSENRPFRDIFNLMAEHLHKKAPTIKVTPFLEATVWRLEWLRHKIFGTTPLVNKETARASGRISHYDNNKSIDQLDFHYLPIEETIRETCKLFKTAGKKGESPQALPLI